MKRHLARMANTDQRVVVVFMQVPNDPEHALVVTIDNLPPRWEQHVMQVVESPEGQGDPDLGNVLGRRMMPDSTETVLQALHNSGLLHKVHIDRVVMFPEPNRPYGLRQILQAMNRLPPEEYAIVDQLNTPATVEVPDYLAESVADLPEPGKFNPHTVNQGATVSEGNIGIANNLLIEAELLETEARAKREKAYSFAPQLRPKAKAAPKSVPTPVPVVETAKPKRAAPTRAKKAQG